MQLLTLRAGHNISPPPNQFVLVTLHGSLERAPCLT